MAKKHEKRFTIEYKDFDGKWVRSGNSRLSGFFSTKEEAQAAITSENTYGIVYHVRQK